MPTTITRTARNILSSPATVCDGNGLVITGQLAPGEYAEVKRVLETAGARWNRSAQAHLFPGDASAALAALLADDRVVSAAEAEQWFPTPAEVVEEMLDLALLQPGLEVLEPSAGAGAIASAVAAAGCKVECIENHPGRTAALEAAGFKVTAADFLGIDERAWLRRIPHPAGGYDRVIMNPPFARNADTRHVLHAFKFVKPGGLLVAIMSAGVTHRGTSEATKIRELASRGGWIEHLPRGAFKQSGAELATVIVVIPVPDDRPLPVDAEPVRVTFDHTEGLPLFVPAAARPGRYVHDSWTQRDDTFRFMGNCIGCGARTWAHEGHSDDVRGAFGDHTCVLIDAEDLSSELGEDVPAGVRFPRCATCWGEQGRYRSALAAAVKQYRAGKAGPAATAPVGPAATATLW